MNLSNIKNLATSKVGRAALQAKKNSPHIMFAAGVVGVVGTAVLASKATLALPEILDEHEANSKVFKDAVGHTLRDGTTYTEENLQADQIKNHTVAGAKVVKLYAPAVLVGGLSIACLTGAHVQLTRRNTALMAAYATVDQALKNYRKRVVDDLGAQKDKEYMFGTEEVEVETGELKKNGEPKTKKLTQAQGAALYAKFYDETNENWSVTPENNLHFLRMHQNYLNQRLQARGHVLLNEVYDALALDRTPEGAVVGWLRDGDGDGYIDFGIWADEDMADMQEFLSGRQKMLLLDFNVDGVVYQQI